MNDIEIWAGLALAAFVGWKLGALLWPLHKAAYWRLRRMAAHQEYQFIFEAKSINSEYRVANIDKRVRL